MQIKIRPDESMTVVGMTGSGKTYFIKYLLSLLRPSGRFRVVILDTKQVGDFTGYPTVTQLKYLHRSVERYFITVYAPNKYERNEDFYNGLFEWCYQRFDTLCVIDELSSVVKHGNSDMTDGYVDLMDRGRARKSRIWQATQKPILIPHSALSEIDHLLCFDLLQETARKKLAANVSNKLLRRAGLKDRHGFWYYHRDLLEPVYVSGLDI